MERQDWELILTALVPLMVLTITLVGTNWRASKDREAAAIAASREREEREASEVRQHKFRVREIQYEGVKQAVVEFLRSVDRETDKIDAYYDRQGVAPGEIWETSNFQSLLHAYEQLELVVEPSIAKVAGDMEAYVRAAFDGESTDYKQFALQRKELLEYVRDYLRPAETPR